MSQTLILLCTLAALAGLPLGYFLAWCWDQLWSHLNALAEAYIAGLQLYSVPEVWR